VVAKKEDSLNTLMHGQFLDLVKAAGVTEVPKAPGGKAGR
jgi:hypothetical protein